jgi:pimeloyl-ACP methyl ester carboxylesterase
MRRMLSVIVLFLFFGCLRSPGGVAWASPPADTSIVTSDTYLVFDLTLSGQTDLELAEPVFDPETQARVSTMTLPLPAETLHVESGYDAKGQVILSSARTGEPSFSTAAGAVSRTRWANDAVTHYDESGGVVPVVVPDDAMPLSLSALVGSFTGASVTAGVIVSDLSTLEATGAVEVSGPKVAVTTKIDGLTTGGTVLRHFIQQGSVWVLSSVEMTATGGRDGERWESRQTLTFSNVSWNLNAAQDAQRLSQRPPSDPAPLRDSFSTAALPPPPACGIADPPVVNAPVPLAVGRGQNIVFQHGFLSSGNTWTKMDDWLSADFRFGVKLLPTLEWSKRIDSQAGDLINLLDASGQNDFLMIGHSDGGLVNRRVGQMRPDLVRGVVTISSPNNGLLLVQTPRELLARALARRLDDLAFGCATPDQDFGCLLAYFLAYQAFNTVIEYGIDAAIPVAGDITPGSSFLQTLNNAPEAFPSVGITNIADQRWVLSRIAGDHFCGPESACGGRAWVTYTEIAFLAFRACTIVGIIRGNPNVAFWCDYIGDRMNDVDSFWKDISADSGGSDGIVDSQGQAYLGATRQVTIRGADSHIGETRSDKVRTALTSVMDSVFQVPRQGTQNPVPQITSIQPATAAAGSPPLTLTVQGNGLGTFSTIQVDGNERTTHYNNQNRTLTTTLTAGDLSAPGARTIQVSNHKPGGGLSNGVSFTVTGTGNNPVPTVTTLAPSTVAAGGAAFTLSVNGFGFVPGAAVQLNGSPRTTTFVSATQVQATVTAADIAAPATLTVRVANPAPGGGVSTTSAPLTVTTNGSNPVPSVAAITPAHITAGGPAFTLTVDGTGFVGTSVVRIDNDDRVTAWVSATRVTAALLATDIAATGTRTIKVRNPAPGGGTSLTSATLTVDPQPPNPVPTVTTLTPASATAGSPAFTLTVDGTGFVAASFVKWNGSQRTTTYISATRVTAAIGAADIAAAGSANVKVVNPSPGGGTSNTLSFTIQPPAANPVPAVSSLIPSSAVAGEPGFALTVVGSNFVGTSFVRWNGSPRSTVFVSPTELTAAISAADIATAGSIAVKVVNPSPGGGTSNTLTFIVQPPPQNPLPQVTTIDPAQVTAGGPDLLLTVNGSGFVASSEVKAGGSKRATTYVSSTQLKALVPASVVAAAGSVTVKVISPEPGGGASNEVTLTVLPPPPNPVPVASAIDPSLVTAGGPGFTLNVYGEGFVAGSTVKMGGNQRPTTYVSPTQLAAQIPASAVATAGSATVKVINPAPGGGTSNDLTLVIQPPPSNPVPAISSLSPSSVVQNSPDFTLTVNGSGFVPASAVKVGGSHRPTTFISDSQVAATVFSSDIAIAGSVTIKVINPSPGGGNSNGVALTVTPQPPNPTPALSAISPSAVLHGGNAFQLTVTGTGFIPSSVVRISGDDRPTIYMSSTQLVGTIFADDITVAHTATIKVRNPSPGGGQSNGITLTIQ